METILAALTLAAGLLALMGWLYALRLAWEWWRVGGRPTLRQMRAQASQERRLSNRSDIRAAMAYNDEGRR